MEGFLQKWVNYVYGWRRRYFILHNGVLYYCSDRGQKSKGVIHLNIAQVIPHPRNGRRLIVDTGCTEVHLKADTPDDCRRWLSALKEEQANLAFDMGTRELRDSESPDTRSRQSLTDTVGTIWNLQAQLESQIDLLSNSLKQNSQIAGILDLSTQMKVRGR